MAHACCDFGAEFWICAMACRGHGTYANTEIR
jgi:hypothetical protein